MEKIKLVEESGEPVVKRIEEWIAEIISKINEIVEKSNRLPKEFWELGPEEIERIGKYIQECDEIEWPKKKLIEKQKDDGRKY